AAAHGRRPDRRSGVRGQHRRSRGRGPVQRNAKPDSARPRPSVAQVPRGARPKGHGRPFVRRDSSDSAAARDDAQDSRRARRQEAQRNSGEDAMRSPRRLELFRRYLDRELDVDGTRELERLLAGDANARAELETYRSMLAELAEAPAPEPAPDFVARVM